MLIWHGNIWEQMSTPSPSSLSHLSPLSPIFYFSPVASSYTIVVAMLPQAIIVERASPPGQPYVALAGRATLLSSATLVTPESPPQLCCLAPDRASKPCHPRAQARERKEKADRRERSREREEGARWIKLIWGHRC